MFQIWPVTYPSNSMSTLEGGCVQLKIGQLRTKIIEFTSGSNCEALLGAALAKETRTHSLLQECDELLRDNRSDHIFDARF